MSDFKSLKLNRDLIIDAINSFSENTKFIKEEGCANERKNYVIDSDGQEVKITVIFVKTGETTLNPKIGKNQEIGIKIAEHIKDYAKLSDFTKNNAVFSVKNITNEDFDLLIEYLGLSFNVDKGKPDKVGIKYSIYNQSGGDSYVIHRYNNGNTLFQGKPLKIFVEIYNFLLDIIDLDNIITINETVYKVSIKKEETQLELESILPKTVTYIGETNKKIFESCLILKKLDIYLPDFSPLVFSVVRGLELYMKQLLLDNGIKTTKKGNFKDIFFESSPDRFILTADAESKISCQTTREKLNECCSFFSVHRHPLFHSDAIPELSKIIEKREDADRIINTTFDLIERTYNEILQVKQNK